MEIVSYKKLNRFTMWRVFYENFINAVLLINMQDDHRKCLFIAPSCFLRKSVVDENWLRWLLRQWFKFVNWLQKIIKNIFIIFKELFRWIHWQFSLKKPYNYELWQSNDLTILMQWKKILFFCCNFDARLNCSRLQIKLMCGHQLSAQSDSWS